MLQQFTQILNSPLLSILIVSLTSFCFPLNLRAQSDTIFRDSIQNEATVFFNKVSKIELVEIKPACKEGKRPVRFIGFLGVKKKFTSCIEATILKSSHKNEGIDTSRIGSRFILEEDNYSKLYNLLYLSAPFTARIACYNPRNGILFYDNQNQIIGYLEICFECRKIYPLNGTPFFKTPDSIPLDEIKSLFPSELLDRKYD